MVGRKEKEKIKMDRVKRNIYKRNEKKYQDVGDTRKRIDPREIKEKSSRKRIKSPKSEKRYFFKKVLLSGITSVEIFLQKI